MWGPPHTYKYVANTSRYQYINVLAFPAIGSVVMPPNIGLLMIIQVQIEYQHKYRAVFSFIPQFTIIHTCLYELYFRTIYMLIR